MLILLDSGSSHSFVSVALAVSLTRVQSRASPMVVKVADGNRVKCDSHIPKVV